MLTNSFACIPNKSILQGWKKILQTTLYGHKWNNNVEGWQKQSLCCTNLNILKRESNRSTLCACPTVGSPGHWMEGNRKGHQGRLGPLGLQKSLQELGYIYAKWSISDKKRDSVCLDVHAVPQLLPKLLFLSSRTSCTFASQVSEAPTWLQIEKSRHNPLLRFHLKIIKSLRVF